MTRGLAPADVVVAGSGLAAAAIALELARRDLSVALLSPGRAGVPHGPGGPVAARALAESLPEALTDLALLARHLWPDWLSGLEEETGLPCEYDERGAMTVALDEAEEVLLDRALDALRSRGVHFEVLDVDEARGREPALSPALHAAFAFPGDGVARSGRVGRALVLAARAAGVRVLEGVRLRRLQTLGGRVSAAETEAGIVAAEAVVLAGPEAVDELSGASALRLGVSALPWLRLDAADDPDRPARLLSSRGVTLVPRRDGSLLALGRSAVPGPELRPAAGAVAALLAETARLVPASAGWSLLEAGCRMDLATVDRLPVLGEAAPPGLFVASGWGAGELLLAPAAAAVLADLVTGRTPALGVAPFAPSRAAA